jgi:hypothetical protein
MIKALILACTGKGWQSDQLDLSTQGINDPQDIFESHRGLARFKIDDEAHTNPCRQGQPRLRQMELLAGGAQRIAELLRRSYGRHGF